MVTVITKISYNPYQVKPAENREKKDAFRRLFQVPGHSPLHPAAFRGLILTFAVDCQFFCPGVYIDAMKEIPPGTPGRTVLFLQFHNRIPRYLPELFGIFYLDAGDLVVTLADELV